VIERLLQQWPDLKITIEPIRTKGDHITDKPLTQLGGDGVFVTEIEHALRDRRIDLAVHSLKDLPTAQPDGLCIIVTGPREDVRDVIIWSDPNANQEAPEYSRGDPLRSPWSAPSPRSPSSPWSSPSLGLLPSWSPRIGTCSLRRTAQLRALCSDVQILPLRGNVDTRLRKLDAGEYDGIVLAAAGLHRLSIQERLADRLYYLPIEIMMPAPGQGVLALEIRDEPEMQALVAPVRDQAAQAATSAERVFMRRLGAGCYLPVAAYGEIVEETLAVQGLVISLDGQRQVRVRASIRWSPETPIEHAEQLGVRLAEQALAQGAGEIIAVMNAERALEGRHA
jgi:hydroxymethylbilane synthase